MNQTEKQMTDNYKAGFLAGQAAAVLEVEKFVWPDASSGITQRAENVVTRHMVRAIRKRIFERATRGLPSGWDPLDPL